MSSSTFEVKVSAPSSEVSQEFLQGMASRMSASYYKYGALAENFPTPCDALAGLRKRLALYEKDGNIEWLMDAANFAMIEYMRPSHPEAHFRSTTSAESPGTTLTTGRAVHNKDEIHRDE
jgi:hypothetical protein